MKIITNEIKGLFVDKSYTTYYHEEVDFSKVK